MNSFINIRVSHFINILVKLFRLPVSDLFFWIWLRPSSCCDISNQGWTVYYVYIIQGTWKLNLQMPYSGRVNSKRITSELGFYGMADVSIMIIQRISFQLAPGAVQMLESRHNVISILDDYTRPFGSMWPGLVKLGSVIYWSLYYLQNGPRWNLTVLHFIDGPWTRQDILSNGEEGQMRPLLHFAMDHS